MSTKYTLVFTFLMALTTLFFTVGCPEQTSTTEDTDRIDVVKDPATMIWSENLAEFRTWELMPGTAKQMTGRGWHTALATVRGNDIAISAVAENAVEMPPGAILVKENFDEAGVLVNIVVMKRQEEGWFWAQYQPEGSVEMSGPELGTCVSCHGMTPNDRVFTWKKKVLNDE